MYERGGRENILGANISMNIWATKKALELEGRTNRDVLLCDL